jgi:hypothetical protein
MLWVLPGTTSPVKPEGTGFVSHPYTRQLDKAGIVSRSAIRLRQNRQSVAHAVSGTRCHASARCRFQAAHRPAATARFGLPGYRISSHQYLQSRWPFW